MQIIGILPKGKGKDWKLNVTKGKIETGRYRNRRAAGRLIPNTGPKGNKISNCVVQGYLYPVEFIKTYTKATDIVMEDEDGDGDSYDMHPSDFVYLMRKVLDGEIETSEDGWIYGTFTFIKKGSKVTMKLFEGDLDSLLKRANRP